LAVRPFSGGAQARARAADDPPCDKVAAQGLCRRLNDTGLEIRMM
jgi:hypothetical protein